MPHSIQPLRNPDETINHPGFVYAEPQKWPGVVGVISIVLASLGLVCGGCGAAWVLVAPSMMKGAEAQMGGPAPDIFLPGMGALVLMVMGTLWSVVLLVAGIMLVRRKDIARKLHVVYAIVAVVLQLVSIGVTMQQQLAVLAWAKDNPDSPWAKQASPVGMIIGLVIGVVIGLGWPIFCLVWFGIIKRRETIHPLPEIVA
jgi:hypothetical protein